MKYHARLVEAKLARYVQAFPCVTVVGARQVGKSTLLEHLYGRGFRSFTFDPVQDLYGARADPDLFLRNNPPPLILDEIQYVPELVPALKRYVDAHRAPGLFLVTGSQQWEVMRRLSESLAGRVAVLELAGFSLGEALERPGQGWFASWLQRAAADPEAAATDLTAGFSAGVSPVQVVWRGSFPEVQTLGAEVVPGWMRGYVSTYLQRDVRSLLAVRDEMQFGAFLALCSALTAQECNCSQMGRDIGLSTPTAQSWLSVLRGTFQWLEVPAFATNQVKKLSQKAKGYVTDTGLACYLARLSSPEALLGHPAFGALFETYVVLDLLKQVQGLPLPPTFHHYRQHSGAEVDLVAELDGRLYPVEIKAASTVKPRDTQSLAGFREKLGSRAGPGLVVYAGREVYRVGDGCLAVPFDLMLT